MSNLRSRDDQIEELVSKLQLLLPQLHTTPPSNKVSSASRVLEDTCKCIKRLQKEVDELSQRLCLLLQTTDNTSDQAALITSVLHQLTTA